MRQERRIRYRDNYNNRDNFKREGKSSSPQLGFYNKFNVLSSHVIQAGILDLEEPLLREVTVKIGLERIDTQERITVEALLDSRVIGLVISIKFVRK